MAIGLTPQESLLETDPQGLVARLSDRRWGLKVEAGWSPVFWPDTMTDNDGWTTVKTAAEGAGAVLRYWVSWSTEPEALVVQIAIRSGAIARHMFPRGTVESVSSLTMRETHKVCINPTFALDSVIFMFGSAEDALLFHWAIVSALPRL